MMADQLRVIGSRQSSTYQGHHLLLYHLGKSSWKVAGWRGFFGERLVARLLRWIPRYRGQRPALIYNLFLANWYSRFGFVHFIWGDHAIGCIDRPERCILTMHQPWEFWTGPEWERLGRCAGIVCMAERECVEIRRRHPHLPCVFIPHGVDTHFWRTLPSPPKRQICAVGRHLRNFRMLLRVARILLDRHPDLNFFWVVNPDYVLPPETVALLPPERFHVLRDLSAEALHRLYAESWLFCTPYEKVGASNAIVESMASGTPIFTTRVGGMPSYDGTGIITMVEKDDDAALVDAVTRCLASPELRSELAKRGREHAVKHFSWPVVVEAHEAFYRRILHSRTRSVPDRDNPTVGKPAAPNPHNQN